ncbi:unnamed protein product, partial [Coregonus sp. 'balchen']
MFTKRMRTEHMKRFKDTKWETYAKCYEEMVKLRLTRRLLEQTHNPWFWNCDSDSESSRSTSQNNKVEPLVLKEVSQLERERKIPPKEPLEQKIPISEELHEGAVDGGCGETEEEKLGKGLTASEPGKKPEAQNTAKQSRKPPRARSQLQKTKETDKENRHPFA